MKRIELGTLVGAFAVIVGGSVWVGILENRVANLENPDASSSRTLAETQTRVLSLERRLETYGHKKIVGYDGGADAYWHTLKTVNCPHGSYVTGVEVVYGGTCLYQCDADGGIVQELRLVCRKI